MKKRFYILILSVLMVLAMSVTAFARGGHGTGNQGVQTRYLVCTVANCDIAGPHQHDRTWYCSQNYLNGGYPVCTFDDCTLYCLHEHEGVYYCANRGASGNMGCGRFCTQ